MPPAPAEELCVRSARLRVAARRHYGHLHVTTQILRWPDLGQGLCAGTPLRGLLTCCASVAGPAAVMDAEGPSPNVYNISTEIINTVTPRAPSYSFGVLHSGTKFISEAHEAIKFGEVRTPADRPTCVASRFFTGPALWLQASPGPSAYDAHKPSKAPAFTFAGANRSETKKFISHAHTKENFGMQSPGPAHDGSKPASSLGGAPAQPFGTGKRPGLHQRVSGVYRRYHLLANRLTQTVSTRRKPTRRGQVVTRSTAAWGTTGTPRATRPSTGAPSTIAHPCSPETVIECPLNAWASPREDHSS